MQTFLPTPDFAESAASLDRARLGKQRVEAMQILKALTTGTGWVNHPATKMWAGSEGALVEYSLVVISEWTGRGYKDTCADKILAMNIGPSDYPSWLGDEDFHLAHKSNLIRKAPDHYGPMWPDVPNDLPYVWPINNIRVPILHGQ